MPKEFGRNLRVAKLIKEELATLIQEKFPLKQRAINSYSINSFIEKKLKKLPNSLIN